jgi:hypothetical protein
MGSKEVNFTIIMKAFSNLFMKYYQEKKDFFSVIIKNNKDNVLFCKNTPDLSDFVLKSLIVILIISLIWLVYDIFYNVYMYFQLSIFLYFKNDKRLIDSPLFKQISHIYYFNDYLSFDYLFVLFATTPLFILLKLYIMEKENNGISVFTYTKILNYAIMIVAVIYFILIYKNIANLGARINTINNIIYNNINSDFIYSEKFCNYLNKKNEYDYKFIYGKCNDLNNNISIAKLYNYIRKIMIDISQNVAPIQNINIETFKTLRDKNGKLYKDKIISALFTYQLIKYYMDNDLHEEAKNFFSTFNLLYLHKSTNILRTRINPILYLRYDDLIIFNKLYEYNPQMEASFGGNKDLYNYVYKEYNNIQNNVQNIVIDIYNICSYKLISIYVYYFILFLILLILVSIYIYYNLKL